MTMIAPEGQAPGYPDDIGLLRAEMATLRAELAEVRGELDALDRGVVKVGQTADLGLARASALGAVMAAQAEAGGGSATHRPALYVVPDVEAEPEHEAEL